jgi:hypothetical protein
VALPHGGDIALKRQVLVSAFPQGIYTSSGGRWD